MCDDEDCGERVKFDLGFDSISYELFMHRLELRRPKCCRRVMRLANTKLNLTTKLIVQQQMRQWELVSPSMQERFILERERQYRDVLKYNMEQHMLQMQSKRRQHLEETLEKR